MYKVRFHLGRGEHFMHWQIKSKLNTGDGTGAKEVVDYVDPQDNQLAMLGCKLSVQPTAAQKIHDGANKTVCAWIECEDLRITSRTIPGSVLDWELRYNPRVEPRWTDGHGQGDYDNQEFDFLWTEGRKVLTTETCKEEQ